MRLSFRSPWRRKGPARRARPATRHAHPRLENLEDRTLLSVALPAPGIPGVATLTGTAGPDSFLVRLKPGVPAVMEFSDNGGSTFHDAAQADIRGIVIDGRGGDDRLTLDESNGLVGEAGGLVIGFTGGPGDDSLIIRGSPPAGAGSVTETYSAGPGGSGTLAIARGAVSCTITATSVEAVTDTLPAALFTVNATDPTDVLHLGDGPIVGGVPTNRLGGEAVPTLDDAPADPGASGGDATDLADLALMPITFANKAHLVINGLGNQDIFTVYVATPAAGLAEVALNGGPGANLAIVKQAPPGVALTTTGTPVVARDGNAAFIEELYVERLGRIASPGEVAVWEQVLVQQGQQAVAQGIENSLEARMDVVKSWYVRYLGRVAGDSEALAWAAVMIRGVSEEQVLQDILSSPEFYLRAQGLVATGTPEQRYIRALYLLLLNRDAGDAEVASWQNALAVWGPDGVALNFLLSREFRTDVINTYYSDLLHRDADAAGLAAWLDSGLDLEHIREGFLGSEEFYQDA